MPRTSRTDRTLLPSARVSSAIARASISTIGSRTVRTAGQNPGFRRRPSALSGTPSSSRSVMPAVSADPPVPIATASRDGTASGTRAAMKFPKTGPATITVGIAQISPNISVSPRSACRLSIATSGPGCGGTSPCRTERPASAGIPIRSNPTSVRRATSSTIGTSSTTPISKNSGSPTSAATPAIAHGSAEPETPLTIRWTIPSAPPDSVSSAPIIEPSAISTPTLPTVLPSPVVNDVTILAGSAPATRPRVAVPRISARNGWNFAHAISSTTTAMPSTAATTSWVVPASVMVDMPRAYPSGRCFKPVSLPGQRSLPLPARLTFPRRSLSSGGLSPQAVFSPGGPAPLSPGRFMACGGLLVAGQHHGRLALSFQGLLQWPGGRAAG